MPGRDHTFGGSDRSSVGWDGEVRCLRRFPSPASVPAGLIAKRVAMTMRHASGPSLKVVGARLATIKYYAGIYCDPCTSKSFASSPLMACWSPDNIVDDELGNPLH